MAALPPTSSANQAVLLCFEEEQNIGKRLAQAAHMACTVVQHHHFPDGEIKLRLPPSLPARVVVLRSLNQPNDKLIELLLTAQTARTLGAQHLTLVAPYLAYMRQDIAFAPGEAISQLADGFAHHSVTELTDAGIRHGGSAEALRSAQQAPSSEVARITGLVPADVDGVEAYRQHLLDKHAR